MGSSNRIFVFSEKNRKGVCFGKGRGIGRENEEEGEEGVDEFSSLLGLERRSGGDNGKEDRKNRLKRKVKWSDRHGQKLVEVLEFQPSDSSDSDGESFLDSCICSVM